MPKPYRREFRDDVVAVARRSEGGVTLEQVAADSGISETCLRNWLRWADVGKPRRPGVTATEAGELRKRNFLPEQENQVLRRAAT